MEIGAKYFSTNPVEIFKGVEAFVDFVEVLPVPGKFDLLRNFKSLDIKFKVHAAHATFGFNPCDKKSEKISIELFRDAVKAADYLEADTIVIHPGYIPKNSQLMRAEQNMKEFFSKLNDDRIFLENSMSDYHEGSYVGGNTPEEIKPLLDEFRFRLCFDFSHAAATSCLIKKDTKEFFKEFLKLSPDYFHVSDNMLECEDEHLHLGDGRLDMNFIKEAVRAAGKPVCLEVQNDLEGRRRDAEFLRR